MRQCVDFDSAVVLLNSGEIVAVSTDTVFGLAGCAESAHAVRQIFHAKQRPLDRPLIVHYGAKPLWQRDCVWTADAESLAQHFWPGPLTMILERNPNSKLCAEVSGCGTTISVRRPLSAQMSALCDTCGPLAAPSANMYQKLSNTTQENTQRAMPEIAVLGGPRAQHGIESTILDLTTQPYRMRRAGVIALEQLQQYVECVDGTDDKTSTAPGTGKHYQPSKPLRLNATHVEPSEALLCFGESGLRAQWTENLSHNSDLAEAAYNLYCMLNKLSMTDCTQIAVVPIPNEGIGVAINDKLLHATYA